MLLQDCVMVSTTPPFRNSRVALGHLIARQCCFLRKMCLSNASSLLGTNPILQSRRYQSTADTEDISIGSGHLGEFHPKGCNVRRK